MNPADVVIDAHVFGKGFATDLSAPVLVIGSDRWGRLDLADLGITQLRAARTITRLASDVDARSAKDLYKKLDSGTLAHTIGVGLHCLFVLWRVFESKGIDAGAWYWAGRDGDLRTFTTLKVRAAKETKKRPRAKRHSRAHYRALSTSPGIA